MSYMFRDLVELDDAVQRRANSLFNGEAGTPLDVRSHATRFQHALEQELEYKEVLPHTLDRTVLEMWGGALASAVHIESHAAYGKAIEVTGDTADIGELEAEYAATLRMFRASAIGSSQAVASIAWSRLSNTIFPSVQGLLYGLDEPASAEDHRTHARACHLARRAALLHAFYPSLCFRLNNGRLRGTTKGVAERRTVLAQPGPEQENYVSSLLGIDPLERVILVAPVTDAFLTNRPDKPFTSLRISDSEALHVNYKNTRWIGVGDRQSVWVRCKVEAPSNGTTYAVAEFEGPTTTDDDTWESWIQVTVRERYDLAPESVHWYPSFPPLESTLARLHFDAHTRGGQYHA